MPQGIYRFIQKVVVGIRLEFSKRGFYTAANLTAYKNPLLQMTCIASAEANHLR